MVPSKPAWGDHSNSSHIIARHVAGLDCAAGGMPGVQSPRACYEYNASSRCSKAACGFAHFCDICGANHGAVSCPKVNPAKSVTLGGGEGDLPHLPLILEKWLIPLLSLLEGYPDHDATAFLASGFFLGGVESLPRNHPLPRWRTICAWW